jgi:flagellar FliL protein
MATTTRDNAPAARRRTRRPVRRLLMLAGLVVVVAAAAVGGWHFWQHRKAVIAAEPPQPVYVSIKPFVVSVLDSNQATRFVQVGVDLEVNGQHAATEVEQALPAIQDAIRLKILQSKLSDVTSPQGVEALRKALIAQTNSAVDGMRDAPAAAPAPQAKPGQHPPHPPQPPPLVRNLYFTELVVE